MRLTRRLLGALALPALAGPALAQPRGPAGPIRIIVPFAAGGGNDTLARLYGQRLSERLGQNVVVDNRPGAFGLIGAAAAMRARPDGTTLMVHPSGPILLDPHAERPPYDLAGDFVPVAMLGRFAAMFLVAEDSPHHTLADLVAWARANPGRALYGTGGVTFRLMAELLNLRAGIRVEHVAFRNSVEAVNSAAAKEVTFAASDVAPAIPAIDGRRIRPIAVLAPERLAAFPDVPTVRESGIEGLDKLNWIGLFAPAGTPPELVARLSAEVVEAGRSAELRQRLATLSIEPDERGPDAFRQLVLDDDATWRDTAARAGIKLER